MFPKHWYDNELERFNFEDKNLSRANEEFLNSSAVKAFQGRMKRKVSSQLILFRINLEERRNKVRALFEKEEKEIEDEWYQRIVPAEVRREQLKEFAHRIRHQKEVERQALATEKIFQRERLSNDSMRFAQRNMHMSEIRKDREKIKEIDARLKREEICEAQFWAAKAKEENEKMLEKENCESAKRKIVSNDIIDQIKRNEERRKYEYDLELENRKMQQDQAVKLDIEIKKERNDQYLSDINKKSEFRKSLDRQIRFKNLIREKNKQNSDSFDKIMEDENCQKITTTAFEEQKKKNETMKHLKNYLHQTNCIKESQLLDNKKHDKMILQTQLELEKHRQKIEDAKQMKYKELIRNIKLAQKDQLLESEKQKALLNLNREKEKQAMQEFIFIEEAKEKILKEKERIKIEEHNKALLGQIKFNEERNHLRLKEVIREGKSMKEAEENYQKANIDMQEKEQLLFKHPWRVKGG